MTFRDLIKEILRRQINLDAMTNEFFQGSGANLKETAANSLEYLQFYREGVGTVTWQMQNFQGETLLFQL